MEGKPSIRVKLLFEPNPHGSDPVASIRGIAVFPGRTWKGIVNPGELWDCDVVYASFNYVMVAPRQEIETARADELATLRYCLGAREVRMLTVDDAADLMRGGGVPPPTFTPQRLPPRATAKPKVVPAPSKAPGTPPASPAPAPPKPATPITGERVVASPPPTPVAKPIVPAPSQPTSAKSAAELAPPDVPAAIDPAISPPSSPPPPPVATATPTSSAAQPPQTPASAINDLRRALEMQEGRAFLDELRARIGPAQAIARIEDALDGQEELLRGIQGEASDARKRLKDVAAQVEEVRNQAREWKRSLTQDLRGVPKPYPKDAENPTDDEIEKEIVHQLYQKNCWGNKYGQYEKLKRGYNTKASDRQVRAAVRRLEERRLIALYPKDTDQFRLNPAKAEEIYQFLGVSPRAAQQLAEDTRDDLAQPDPVTRRDLETAMEGGITRIELDRILAPLRQKVAAMETPRTSAPIGTEPTQGKRSDLDEVRNMMKGLQGDLNRVRKLAEDATTAQRRIAERLDAIEASARAP